MALTDTSATAADVYVAAYAAVDGAERVQRAAEMAEEAKAIALAGIRARNPELTEVQVARAWLVMLHGPELVGELDDAV